MDPNLDESLAPKHCPLLKSECLQDGCVFWIRSTEMVRKSCAVVIIAQQLNLMAVKTNETRLS